MFYKSFCLPERHSRCKQKPSNSINLNAICWKFHLGTCGRNQDEASEDDRHQATEHSLKLVDPMMVVGQKPGTRISTRVIIFRTRSFRFALISRGRHNLTLIFFLQSIVILTPLSIYPSFTSAFQSLEPGRTQNQDPCHGQYGRLVANSLLVHLTVDR